MMISSMSDAVLDRSEAIVAIVVAKPSRTTITTLTTGSSRHSK